MRGRIRRARLALPRPPAPRRAIMRRPDQRAVVVGRRRRAATVHDAVGRFIPGFWERSRTARATGYGYGWPGTPLLGRPKRSTRSGDAGFLCRDGPCGGGADGRRGGGLWQAEISSQPAFLGVFVKCTTSTVSCEHLSEGAVPLCVGRVTRVAAPLRDASIPPPPWSPVWRLGCSFPARGQRGPAATVRGGLPGHAGVVVCRGGRRAGP